MKVGVFFKFVFLLCMFIMDYDGWSPNRFDESFVRLVSATMHLIILSLNLSFYYFFEVDRDQHSWFSYFCIHIGTYQSFGIDVHRSSDQHYEKLIILLFYWIGWINFFVFYSFVSFLSFVFVSHCIWNAQTLFHLISPHVLIWSNFIAIVTIVLVYDVVVADSKYGMIMNIWTMEWIKWYDTHPLSPTRRH